MKNLLLVSFLGLFLFSCKKQNLRSAKDSLEGTWKITEIYSASGTKMANGIDISDEETETGDLGTFIFTEDDVDYTFTRQSATKTGTANWNLNRSEENSGFTKVEVYTLTFDDFIFDCAFGDETSDAEKNATDIRITSETTTIGDYSTFSMQLMKE